MKTTMHQSNDGPSLESTQLISRLAITQEDVVEQITSLRKSLDVFRPWIENPPTLPFTIEQLTLWQEEIEAAVKSGRPSFYQRLADFSWYIDPHMSFETIETALNHFEAAETTRGHDSMAAWFRSRMGSIEEELVRKHPERAVALRQAFTGHRQGLFTLSVLGFIAQADGVSSVITGHGAEFSMFTKFSAQVEALTKRVKDSFAESALQAFKDRGAMRVISEAGSCYDGLNRNAAVHGADPDPGNERKSLQALSLLWFLSCLVEETAGARRRSAE